MGTLHNIRRGTFNEAFESLVPKNLPIIATKEDLPTDEQLQAVHDDLALLCAGELLIWLDVN